MTHYNRFSTEMQVFALYQSNSDRAELLALADHCLEEHNAAWALWLATGSHEAFLAALAAKRDREALLGEVGRP